MEITSEKIWTDHYKKLKAFTLSRVKDSDACNDILQDVFIKLHLNLHTLKHKDRIEPWVYQITRNEINSYFRKQKITIDTEELELPEETFEVKNNSRFTKCFISFIKKLPDKYKEAIELVELKNFSQLQLSEKLNISYSGAKSRVQRGRELLKKHFSDCCDVTADKYGNIVSARSSCSACQI